MTIFSALGIIYYLGATAIYFVYRRRFPTAAGFSFLIAIYAMRTTVGFSEYAFGVNEKIVDSELSWFFILIMLTFIFTLGHDLVRSIRGMPKKRAEMIRAREVDPAGHDKSMESLHIRAALTMTLSVLLLAATLYVYVPGLQVLRVFLVLAGFWVIIVPHTIVRIWIIRKRKASLES